MPAWEEYKSVAKARGALALELFVVESTPLASPDEMMAVLPEHLEYQQKMEAAGKLFLAGPLSDSTGELMQGTGMMVYRTPTIDDAKKIADGDPMHAKGMKTYKIRKWLVNEGALSLSISLSKQHISVD